MRQSVGSGNPSQEGAGLYSHTENLQSAMIETSAVIVYLWQCYASLGVSHTPSAHLKTAIHKNNNRRRG